MRLTTVLSCANDNPNYYKFIPYQIKIWKYLNIKFIAVFVGNVLPEELLPYKDNIFLWNYTEDLPSVFVAQNLRLYMPALLRYLPDDELVMITDMDIFPTKIDKYIKGLETCKKENFINYTMSETEMYICYNAAHPETWSKLFGINCIEDIINSLRETYSTIYPIEHWFTDQTVLFKKMSNNENLIKLNCHFIRLDYDEYIKHLFLNENIFIDKYDDAHYHRSFYKHREILEDTLRQMDMLYNN